MTEAIPNRKVILIAEDAALNRVLLRKIFENEFIVQEAENGAQALSMLHSLSKVDLMILDIMMPVMNGFEVLKKMRADPCLSAIPVIVATASSDDVSQIHAFDLGAEDVFTKPFNPRVLLARANNVIAKADSVALKSRLARQEELLRLAQHDTLTGLYSRDAFCAEAARLIAAKPDGHYIITCLDVDSFKIVNDQYGAEVGNRLLINIADTIRGLTERLKDGIAARISADNFAALLPAATPPFIQQVANTQREYFLRSGIRLMINMSAGRYVVQDRTLSVTAMLDRAILAKRTVKGRYGNNTVYFNEKMRAELLREQTLIGQMESALQNQEFEPWLQLQYNHATKTLVGAEALVHWNRPNCPPILPGEFIPLFERNGFIYEVDKAVWRKVCALLRKWIDKGFDPLPISVNISRIDLFRSDFFETLTGLLREYRIPVNLLRLEITESAFSEETGALIAMVKRLRAFGFIVEIDDFGSGYSSLNTLKDVPADVLKLDIRFLESSEDARRGGSIVESIIRMAKWLDMSVIAEGVETVEQADFLKSIGCCYIQGYLYSKPMPVAQCEEMICGAVREARLAPLKTVSGMNTDTFWDPSSIDTLLFSSYVGSACVLELSGTHCEIVRINDRYIETLRTAYSMEEVLKSNPLENMSAADAKLFLAGVEDSARVGCEFRGELSLCLPLDVRPHTEYLRYTGRVIAQTADSRFVYLLTENITDQKLAEKREHEVSARLRSVMANVSCGICAYAFDGAKGSIAFANNRYYELLGYTKEQFEREIEDTFDYVYPNDREELKRLTEEIFHSGKPFTHEYRCIRRDQRVIWVRCSAGAYTISGFDGSVLITEMSDITGQKAAEKKERETFEQVMFLNDTSKSLLTPQEPMNAINGFLQKLLDYFSASRANVYEFTPDGNYLENTYALCAPGIKAIPSDRKITDPKSISDWRSATKDSRYTVLERTALTGRLGAGRQLQILDRRGIDTLIAVSLLRDDICIGFIGIDDPKRMPASVGYLETLGDYMAVMLTRRDYEKKLKNDNDMLNRLIQDMPGGYMRMKLSEDDAPVPLFFNDSFCRLLNMPRSQVEALYQGSVLNGIHENDVSAFKSLMQAAKDAGAPVGSLIRLKAGAKGFKWLMIYCGASRDSVGNTFWNVYFTDAKERMAAEKFRRELLDNLPCGAVIYEFNQGVLHAVFVNQSYREMAAGGADMDYKDNGLAAVHPDDRAAIMQEITEAIEENRDIDIVLRLLYAQNDYRPYHVVGRIVAREKGRAVIYATYAVIDEEARSLRQMLTEAVQNIPAGIAIFEQKNDEIKPMFVSDNACDCFGYTRAEYNGRIARGEPVFPPSLEKEMLGFRAHTSQEVTHERILTGTRKGGKSFDMRVRIRKRMIGERIIIYCTLTDITRLVENERQKRLQDARYRLLVELRKPVISDYDAKTDIMTVIAPRPDGSSKETVFTEYMRHCGRGGVILPDSRDEYVTRFTQVLQKPSHGSFIYHADYGSGMRWYRTYYTSLADEHGVVTRLLCMSEDVTAEHQEHQKLVERAEYDAVTKIMNRASAEEFLKNRVKTKHFEGMDALFMIDIDNFKLINDSKGHPAGDAALREFADMLKRTFRAGDLVCRYGGDEFLVYMPNCGSKTVAIRKAQSLLEKLAERKRTDPGALCCSIGVAIVENNSTDLKTVLAHADHALYLSKQSGKNTCTMYETDKEQTE